MEADNLSLLRTTGGGWAAEVTANPTTLSNISVMRLVMLLDSLSFLATSFFNTVCVGAALVW